MIMECEHASILGKKMSPFGRAVMEIFNLFFLGQLTYAPPCTIDRGLIKDYNGKNMTNPYQCIVYEKQEKPSS